MTTNEPTSYDAWEAGAITDMQALRAIWSDLREVESDLALLQAQRDQLRDQLSQIVARTGTVTLPGFGRVTITAAATTVSYDRAALAALIGELRGSHPEIAARISEAERVSMRSGGLRIEAERAKDKPRTS
ncbi:MAG: hypothetical protein SH847_24550 [Roseiflexaceae bacterium]|nr:hypothetical protein [Roseiflexaceae bacterium]